MSAQTAIRAGIAALLALAVPALIALLMDERTLSGITVWAKPLKFDVSLALHLFTFYVLLKLLPEPALERSWFQVVLVAGVFAAIIEALYITLQAARGRHSHFNNETPLEAFLYFGVMSTGAVLLVVSSFAVGWQVWRCARADTADGLRTGAAAGLMLGSVATLLVASVLSSGAIGGPGHWVGGVRSDTTGLPLFGWSTTGGDLRVPHFFATHMMQALPIAGWIADRLVPRHARTIVAAIALANLAVVGWTFHGAVSGCPIASTLALSCP